jgi:3-isopropylmalate/(R)-2-methylmalate dehydratase small subunit
VTAPSVQETFAFDDFRRWCLLEGYDDIDLSLRHVEEITTYEDNRPSWLPTA